MKQFGKARIIFMIFVIILIILVISSLITATIPFLSAPKSSQNQYDYKQKMDESSSSGVTSEDYEGGYERGISKREDISTKDQDSVNQEEQVDDRMKVYFGFLRLRVDNITESRSTISSMADEAGGYVEESYEDTIIIRIPKELFKEILGRLMNLGEVLNKSIETYDVTDFFQDLTARLEIAKTTRDRLYALLERITDVKERLKILKEIRRLSEEIENINLTLENIKRLISFSRITIKLEQRLTDLSTENKQTIPFAWIAALDPFYISLARLSGRVSINLGDEFAVFKNKRYFFAESTEGVRLHIASTKNTPRGDSEFWQKAVEYHLSRFYKGTEFLDLGVFKAVEFTSKDAEPFTYIVGVFVRKDTIFVCEVLFPNRKTYSEWGDEVKEYITGSTIR
ncbi:MAG: DUF4349 domain-containing protein [Spirochaetales bacterium]|nr:DUF4349 domain-containing protein [Spirochaetales bacterium]